MSDQLGLFADPPPKKTCRHVPMWFNADGVCEHPDHTFRNDGAAGAARRDAAVRSVDAHTDDAWKTAALTALRDIATARAELTTDHVWELLDERGITRAGIEPRALGSIMRGGVKRCWIRSTGRVEPTVRPEAHRNPKAVWASLIHKGES